MSTSVTTTAASPPIAEPNSGNDPAALRLQNPYRFPSGTFARMNARNIAIVLAPVITAAVLVSWSGAVASAAESATTASLPSRPEQIAFEPLEFTPPSAEEFRHVLPDGTVVYLAESTEFPLIDLSISFKGGSSLDMPEIPGLATMTARMLREGGTKQFAPETFDEQLDFLATQASVSAGGTFTTASMNCLKKTFDESLSLFLEMLREPAFNADRLATAKARLIAQLEQRNDDASSILGREWRQLLFGAEHFEGSQPTAASVEKITPERLAEMHARVFHPGNMIVAVSGDFDSAEMLSKLEKAFADWDRGEPVADPPVPDHQLVPGLYHVPKDIPQGKVAIGMRSITRDDPDAIALDVLNDILGGGGFTSRIMRSVRSNEGLAYSAASRISPRVEYPGEFRAGFESKNPTVALAIKIILQQVDDVREDFVTEEELETAKQSLIETFPRVFESKPQMLSVFVSDEWTHRPEGYWQGYRDRVKAITAEDVQRVARKHLDPEKMAILVVGNWDEISPGDLDGRASMNDFFGGEVTHLPLRDPLTLEPL
jgi:zinc protease